MEVDDGYPGDEGRLSYDDLAARGRRTRWHSSDPPTTCCFSIPAAPRACPKGVMWRHEDLWCVTGAGGNPRLGLDRRRISTYIERLRRNRPGQSAAATHHARHRPAVRIGAMTHGGTCVTLPGRSFDAESRWPPLTPTGSPPAPSSATPSPARWRMRWTPTRADMTSRLSPRSRPPG